MPTMKTLERFEWTRSPSRLIGLPIKGDAEGEAPELAKLTFAHRSEKHCADGGSTESRRAGEAAKQAASASSRKASSSGSDSVRRLSPRGRRQIAAISIRRGEI